MINVEYVAYRFLTDADFFNLYKPPGSEQGGSGQTYIDFPTSGVTEAGWMQFFDQAEGVVRDSVAQGWRWAADARSIGVASSAIVQRIVVARRRAQSFSVMRQHERQDRLRAWRPEFGFPRPLNPNDRHGCPEGLAVFLARCAQGQIWAGWYTINEVDPLPVADEGARSLLHPLFLKSPSSGLVDVRGKGVVLDENNHKSPFRSESTSHLPMTKAPTTIGAGAADPPKPAPAHLPEVDISRALLDQDEIQISDEPTRKRMAEVRQRNVRAVKALKVLYGNTCQGNYHSFAKKDGTNYVEVHHLVPLGAGGSDSPHNMVVISPMLHRMLHYADVQGLDLANIQHKADGSAELNFLINGSEHKLRWHPAHAQIILSQSSRSDVKDD